MQTTAKDCCGSLINSSSAIKVLSQVFVQVSIRYSFTFSNTSEGSVSQSTPFCFYIIVFSRPVTQSHALSKDGLTFVGSAGPTSQSCSSSECGIARCFFAQTLTISTYTVYRSHEFYKGGTYRFFFVVNFSAPPLFATFES